MSPPTKGGKKCAVASCPNKYFTTRNLPNAISYFRFPKDPELRKIWIRKCQREEQFNPNSARICSEHFSSDDIEDRSIAQKMGFSWPTKLKRNVIPTKNLGSNSSLPEDNVDVIRLINSPEQTSSFKNYDKEEREELDSRSVHDKDDMSFETEKQTHNEEINELEIEYNELGIIGSVLKSYDELSVHSRKAGQIELLIGNHNYCYVITIKRLDKVILMDEYSFQNPPLKSDKNIVQPNIYINTKNGIMKYNLCRSSHVNSKVAGNPLEQSHLKKKEGIKDQGISKVGKSQFECNEQNVKDKGNDEDFTVMDSSTENNGQVPSSDTNIELEKHPHNYQDSNNLEESLFSDEKCTSEDDDYELIDDGLNEISDDDQNDEINSDGSSDSENNSSLMDALDDVIVNQVEPDKFVYQCKICNARTLRINKLKRHIKRKHRSKKVTIDQPDTRKGDEIRSTDNSDEDLELPRSSCKRERDIEKLLALLDNKSARTKPDEMVCESESLENGAIHENAEDVDNDEHSDEIHKCRFCDFTSNNLTALYRHIGLDHAHNPNNHNKKGKLRTDCVFCPYKGLSRRSLLIHLRRNHRDSQVFECSQCSYKTKYKTSIDRHVQVIHDKKRWKCHQCDYLASRKYVLKNHILFKHQGITPFKCEEPGCDYGSLSNATRRAHMIKVHKKTSPFVCTVSSCNYSATSKLVLKSHMYIKHGIGDPPVVNQCPHCNQKYTEKGNLYRHISKKHLGPMKRFKCSECDFAAGARHSVKTHISEVHLGQFRYCCEHCDFKCSIRSKLQTHLNIVHLGLRPYQCEFCHYKATQPVRLKRHVMEVHKREKPHHCVYCSFHTAQRCNLKAHLKSIHKISDDNIKQVLLSCVDTSAKQSSEVVQDLEIHEEIVTVARDEVASPLSQYNIVQDEIILTAPH